MSNKPILKSFVNDNIWVTFGHVLLYAKGIILLPILIKNLGITIYGAYVLLITAAGFLFGISSFGVGFRYRRFMPSTNERAKKRKLFYTQFYFQTISIFILSAILIGADNFIKSIFFKNGIDFSIHLFSAILFFTLFWSQFTDYFRYTDRMKLFSIVTSLNPYLNITFIIIFIYFFQKLDLNHLLLTSIFSMGIIIIPFSFSLIKEIGIEFPTFELKNILADIKIGFPLMLSNVVDFILSGSDRFIIAFFLSVTAVGYYNSAYALGSLIILFPKVLGVVLPPLLSRSVDEGKEQEAQTLINYAIKLFLLIAIPFIVGSYVLSKPLLTVFANEEVASNAAFVIPIVALGILFYGLTVILNNIFFVRMKTKVMFKATAFAGAINMILNLIFLYFFKNVIIAAFTTLISYIIVFFYVNNISKTIWKINWNYEELIKSILSALLMATILILFQSNFDFLFESKIIFLSTQIFISISIYFLMILMSGVFSKKELNVLIKVFNLRK